MDDAVQDAPIEQEVEQVVEPVEQAEQTEQVVEKPKEEPIPKGVQKRIDRAVRRQYEAEARARVLEEQLQALSRQPQQATKVEGEPKLEQFDNIEDYVTAKAKWVAKQELDSTLTARERQTAEAQQRIQQQTAAETWAKRVAIATAELPDFEEVVASSDITFDDPVTLQAIQESDLGPQIAYYLASNPDEADAIARLKGAAAIRAIGRIEAKIEGKSASVTKTPEPIKPVGQKAKAEKSPADMSPAEFAAWRKKFIASRGSR